ncbi:hypothetical protein MPTK2_3g12960 [Marchantia polymorpha subsp. ruderalis]
MQPPPTLEGLCPRREGTGPGLAGERGGLGLGPRGGERSGLGRGLGASKHHWKSWGLHLSSMLWVLSPHLVHKYEPYLTGHPPTYGRERWAARMTIYGDLLRGTVVCTRELSLSNQSALGGLFRAPEVDHGT